MNPSTDLNFTDNSAQIQQVFEIGNLSCQSPVMN